MIARHSLEQSGDGEGVEVVENKKIDDPKYGKGQYTEKRIHLSKYIFWVITDHIYLIIKSCILAVCLIGFKQ